MKITILNITTIAVALVTAIISESYHNKNIALQEGYYIDNLSGNCERSGKLCQTYYPGTPICKDNFSHYLYTLSSSGTDWTNLMWEPDEN